jgi:hypothetical protein
MKKLIAISLLMLLIPQLAFADVDVMQIINIFAKIYGLNVDMLDTNRMQLERMENIIQGLTGHNRYGSIFDDSAQYYWGSGATSWENILALTNNNLSAGDLARVMSTLIKDYPIDPLRSSNEIENKYYLLQAQTTLASRSTSQLAFDQISKEENVIKSLQSFIDTADNNKAATDLNNRLVSEQNRLSIQQAKLLAILVQQVSVDAQEKANRAKEDADFFDYN